LCTREFHIFFNIIYINTIIIIRLGEKWRTFEKRLEKAGKELKVIRVGC